MKKIIILSATALVMLCLSLSSFTQTDKPYMTFYVKNSRQKSKDASGNFGDWGKDLKLNYIFYLYSDHNSSKNLIEMRDAKTGQVTKDFPYKGTNSGYDDTTQWLELTDSKDVIGEACTLRLIYPIGAKTVYDGAWLKFQVIYATRIREFDLTQTK